MPYGIIKVDQVTFTNAGVDQTISVSGIVASISGNITATGTISGNVIRGGTTVSGATVTGTAGQFGTITGNTAGFTTVTGTTVTGTTATFTSGVFTNISGETHTITSGVFASGTAANPSITFQGDVNTGIYSPGADQVAISTNGSGRLFVDASGRVGMGASEGTYAASVTATGNNGFLVKTGTASAVQIYAGNTGGEAALGTLTSDPLNLITAGSSRIRITSAGLVGVGTSSPSYKLHIVNDGNNSQPTLLIQNPNAGGSAATYFSLASNSTQNAGLTLTSTGWGNYGLIKTQSAILEAGGTASTFLGLAGQAGILFGVGASPYSEVMRIDASGRVGIGTSSPQQALTVVGGIGGGVVTSTSDIALPSVATNGYLRLVGQYQAGTGRGGTIQLGGRSYSDSGNVGAFLISANSTGNFNTTDLKISTQTSFNNVISDIVTITNQGAVGIGSTLPLGILEVKKGGASTTANLVLTSGGVGDPSSVDPSIQFAASGAESAGTTKILSTGSYGLRALAFHTGSDGAGTEKARIDSSGRLLVGTSNYTGNSKFVVAGLIGGDVGLLDLRYTGSRPTAADITVSEIRFGSSDLTANTAYARIIAESDGASSSGSDIPGRLVFSTTADGASSPTERVRIDSAGVVTFTASSNNATFLVQAANSASLVTCQGFKNSSGTYVGAIYVNNTNTTYSTSSDYRLKENIEPVTEGIARLKQLKPCRFNFIAAPEHTVDGFLAHEAAEVVPECATGQKDAVDDDGNPIYQGIDQSKLVPLLTAALQEAVAKIETLEARLTAAGIA